MAIQVRERVRENTSPPGSAGGSVPADRCCKPFFLEALGIDTER